MKSNPRSIYELFDGKRRYVVPLYQRQYVWNRDDQWAPLWEDILSMAVARLDGREMSPHFLGAMVLEQMRTFGNEVPSHTIIDGQQRLTTFQIFLAALRDVARKHDSESYAEEIDRYVKNTGLMAAADVEQFKVWPTKADQEQFRSVMTARSVEALEAVHPPVFVRRKLQPRPQMVEAYLYFSKAIEDFLGDEDYGATKEGRVEALYLALRNDLQAVAIELEGNDDAQLIFETLNARGEPLLPSDLLRNYIFRRAGQSNEKPDELHEKYWSGFEQGFWGVEEKQGRLKRARIALFMQHFLALKKGYDINVGHMFQEYKSWIKNEKPYTNVEGELVDLVRHADAFKGLIEPGDGTRFDQFARRLKTIDVRTIYPLALFLLVNDELSPAEVEGVATDLESYLVRRAICGKTTKNYNKAFLQIVRDLRSAETSRESVRRLLLDFKGDAGVWPDDAEFERAWMNMPVYEKLGPAKVEAILHAVEDETERQFGEEIKVLSTLTVEHIMPQTWEENWPLPSVGGQVMGVSQSVEEQQARAQARDVLIHTFGNLTLLTQPLNSSVSNSPYEVKRQAIIEQSALKLNRYFQNVFAWDESSIRARGKQLFDVARKIWPYPQAKTMA